MILDNEVYQADATGQVHHISDMSKPLPFASVHFPIHNTEFRQSDVTLASLRQGIAQSEGHQG